MANLLVKALVAAGGVGVVGGGATFLIVNNLKEEDKSPALPTPAPAKDKKISALLEGKVFIAKSEQSGDWQTQWTKFKEKYNTTEQLPKPWEFTNWKGTKDTTDTINIFKDQCEKNKDTLVTGKTDPIFVEISTYCPTKANV